MFPFSVFLLGLSAASCAEFATVYEWEGRQLDYSWPTEASRKQAVRNGTFKPDNIYLSFMAVYKNRIFLSIWHAVGIPVTLVSIPASSASSAPPKLAPFPNWQHHKKDGCIGVQRAKGLEVDSSYGRLWVVDDGTANCTAKLWIFNLENHDRIELIHHFPSSIVSHSYDNRALLDIVLDETPEDTCAYITDHSKDYIVVFSLKTKSSRAVKTLGQRFYSIALSRKEGAKQLYLIAFGSKLFSSAPVSDFRLKNSAETKLVGNWSEFVYKILIDNAGVLYAASYRHEGVSAWNTSRLFSEQRFYEPSLLLSDWPFTLALDATGTLWMTERNETGKLPRHRLLRAVDGVGPDLHITSTASTVATTSSTTPIPVTFPTSTAAAAVPLAVASSSFGCARTAEDSRQGRVLIDILICLAQCRSPEAANVQLNSESPEQARKISIVIS